MHATGAQVESERASAAKVPVRSMPRWAPATTPVVVVGSALIVVLAGLVVTDRLSYLVYHSVVESLVMGVSLSIFFIAWHTRHLVDDDFLTVLGVAQLFVGLVTVLHLLGLNGMPVFAPAEAKLGLGSQFWLILRGVQAVALLVAPLFIGRRLRRIGLVWIGFGVPCALLVFAVFAGWFPKTNLPLVGLMSFKIEAEFVIVVVLLAAMAMIVSKREELDRRVFRDMVLAIALMVVSESLFVVYADPYDALSTSGHVIYFASIAAMYDALVVEALEDPHSILFRRIARSETKYQSLVETTSDFIWETDREGRYTYCSPQMRDLWGIEPDEMLGKSPFTLMSPEERERVEAVFEQTTREPCPFTIESTACMPGGRLVHVETAAVPVFDDDHAFIGFRGVTRDVTNRVEAERDVRTSEQRYALLSEANSVLLATDDPESVIQQIAEKAMHHLGADVFFNYVLDPFSDRLRLNAWGGVDERVAKMIERLELGQAICGCVARDGERIISNDVQNNGDPRADLVRRMGVRSYVCHPLRVRGQTAGTLSFGTKRKDEFAADEIDLMRTLADQVSVAIDKARLYEAQKIRRRRIEALHGVLQVGVSSLDVPGVAKQMLEYLVGTSHADYAHLWLTNGEQLELAAQVGYPESYAATSPVPLSSSLDAVVAFRSGREMIVTQSQNPEVIDVYERMGLPLGSYAILPLESRLGPIGVLSLVWAERRELNEFDVEFYKSVAAEVAIVLQNAMLFRAEHTIAETLQETLVVLPAHVPGIRFSRAYESATFESGRVGGDFVDVFHIAGPLVGIALGDVSGKGIDAAVTTSTIRTTLRVHALDGLPPSLVVAKANAVMRRLTSTESFVTLWFATLNTKTGQVRYVCAGHPPALVVSDAGRVKQLECVDPILGAFDDVSYFEQQAVLAPGERLVLYSDGVTEARSAHGAFLGDEGLVELLAEHSDRPVLELAGALIESVIEFSAGVLRDDAAILVVEPASMSEGAARTQCTDEQLQAFDCGQM